MRTTLNIDDDVLQAAKERARHENKTTGEVISQLARSALTAAYQAPRTSKARAHYGLRPFPKRGRIVTNDLIDKLRENDA